MIPISAEVKIDLSGLQKYADLVTASPPPSEVVACLKQWAARYRAFAQQEFNRKSKGTGWEPLKPATIARRRKGPNQAGRRGKKSLGMKAAKAGVGNVAILRDTGLLFAALNPELNTRGGFERYPGGFAVTVGYGGPASHKKGRVSIADLAAIHHKGLGHVPPRPIIINPTAAIKAQMADDAQRALNRLAEGS
mgnify:CR=1 FL=1